MKLWLIFPFTIILTLLISGCVTVDSGLGIQLNNPVFLVHGIGFSSREEVLDYWEGVTPELDRLHIPWFASSQPAFGLIEDNAVILKTDILSYLKAHPQYRKVNIIAHSRGGLESRYMISKLGMVDYIASLTTIATPHHGSAIADILYKKIRNKNTFIIKAINSIFYHVDNSDPYCYQSGMQLTRGAVAEFNTRVPDIPGIYYQSYAGQINSRYPNPIFASLSRILEKYEGPNDGLVSVESAAWGRFRGIPLGANSKLSSHASLIGFEQMDGYCLFNTSKFIRLLLFDLADMGF